jgi:ABC-type transport system involved in multi-copper enzyme maturation permease subunit
MKILNQRDLLWILPLSLGMGAILSSLQPGNWLTGWLGFSFLFFLCFLALTFSTRWANGGKALVWMVALAFALRFMGGVATYLLLPVNGYADDEDDRAGFVYTDAHRRDEQAWDLASSDKIIGDFNQSYAYDQYGGLLTMSAFIYRYLSPDAHRTLMLVLVSAFMAALGLPFLWKSVTQQWSEKVAMASCWIYALYPESILLGGSAMREPYLMAFSAFALWGFVNSGVLELAPARKDSKLSKSKVWLGLGIVGMLFVSPVVALVTLVIFAGWMYFASERGRISWRAVAVVIAVFVLGLFMLSSALDRQGNLGGNTPIAVINNFVRESFKWNVFKIEEGSGWVQKLFDEMPESLRLPFVMVYGVFQPVLPAAIVEPTTLTWRVIAILRALGWYALLPVLILFFAAGSGQGVEAKRRVFLWLGFTVWGWILFTALRGGGDQWDNPRYRTILFLWQAILAGNVWVWWRETRNAWLPRVALMEVVFLLFFGQWYANRYWHFGRQLPFGLMVALILAFWVLILLTGWLLDRKRRIGHSV